MLHNTKEHRRHAGRVARSIHCLPMAFAQLLAKFMALSCHAHAFFNPLGYLPFKATQKPRPS